MKKFALLFVLACSAAWGMTNVYPTITGTASIVSQANPQRAYLQVQNNHATLSIYVNPDGAKTAATTADIKILPGQNWAPLVPPKGAISVIGDAGTNNAVVVTEGN